MDDFSLWDLMVSMFWFMLLVAWIWLLISILGDIFRDRELGGGAKAMWVLFLIFLPWLGALMYLIFRGNSMNDRTRQAMEEAESASGPTSRARRDRQPAWRTRSVTCPR